MSWLKNGTGSGAGNLCGACQPSGSSQLLGVACSDPYGASTNGSQATLSPRSEVNASTGYFPFPGGNPAWSGALARRIQCQAADVNPALNAGALYYGEAQYVRADDAAAGHQNNNASYRPMTFAAGSFNATLDGRDRPAAARDHAPGRRPIRRRDPDRRLPERRAVHRREEGHEPRRRQSPLRVRGPEPELRPLGPRLHRGLPRGHDRSRTRASRTSTTTAASLTRAPLGRSRSTAATISWATELFAANPNANALRWGTLYNFWFDATAPAETAKTIEPFKPEPCPADPVITPGADLRVQRQRRRSTTRRSRGSTGPTATTRRERPDRVHVHVLRDDLHVALDVDERVRHVRSRRTRTPGSTRASPTSTTPNGDHRGLLGRPPRRSGRDEVRRRSASRRTAGSSSPGRTSGSGPPRSAADVQDHPRRDHEQDHDDDHRRRRAADRAATRGIERQDGLVGVQGSCDQAGSAVAGTSWTWTPVRRRSCPRPTSRSPGSTGPNGIAHAGRQQQRAVGAASCSSRASIRGRRASAARHR